jgi:raffinose/stachyose/melibiose transport system permease protein
VELRALGARGSATTLDSRPPRGAALPVAALATRTRAGGGAPRLWGLRRRHYLYLAPAVGLFGAFVIYPIVYVVKTSFTLHDVASVGRGTFANYLAVFEDPPFWTAFKNMAYWGAITIVVQMVLGAILAYLIENYTRRSKAIFRTVFFLPVVTSVSVIALLWEQIYAPEYGPLQYVLQKLGIVFTGNLLAQANTVVFALIIVNIWEYTGFSMFLYIVGIHRMPKEVLDSATIDGASGFRLARHVIAPLLSNVTKSLVLLGVIGTLQTFPLVYLMTNGGPDHASEVFGTYIFTKAFIVDERGYASALSVLTLIIAFVATVIQLRFFGTKVGFAKDDQ